ncbi:unnamed protein product [Pocillopora meandrina]|uniref:Uncharacterized protein n=1 Tax=Pocillopora meandrina TaxID=46732 RepID=A0AAU9W0Q2_9CNID|nr:unnamed protein product [Pocillopora meandrina]
MTMMPRRIPQMNFEGEANNRLLDEEDTQQSNLSSKYIEDDNTLRGGVTVNFGDISQLVLEIVLTTLFKTL